MSKDHAGCDGTGCDVCQKSRELKGLTWQRHVMWGLAALFVAWAAVSISSISLVWRNGNTLIAARQAVFAAEAKAQGYPKTPSYTVAPLPWYVRYFLLFRPSHRAFYLPVAVSRYKAKLPPPAPYEKLGRKGTRTHGGTPRG